MKIGIVADTHDELARSRAAVQLLQEEGAEALVHCGDLSGPEIVAACAVLPLYFTFGNHDADMVPYLKAAAEEHGANCLGWGGEITLAGKRIAIVHGHLTFDLRPLLAAEPDYLLSGHSHIAGDWLQGRTRRINPGALHRADKFSVAMLDLATEQLRFLSVE
jgi:uncharacterized protein